MSDLYSEIGDLFVQLDGALDDFDENQEAIELLLAGLENHLDQLRICKRFGSQWFLVHFH